VPDPNADVVENALSNVREKQAAVDAAVAAQVGSDGTLRQSMTADVSARQALDSANQDLTDAIGVLLALIPHTYGTGNPTVPAVRP
jgi:hypothetical protein